MTDISVTKVNGSNLKEIKQKRNGQIKDDTVENGFFLQTSSFFFSTKGVYEKEYRPKKRG